VNIVSLCLTSVVVLGWSLTSLWFPFAWDHGILASIGDIVLHGGMPFRDGWDMKGPVAYLPFALTQFVFGRHLWSIRVFDLALLIAACISFARMISRLSRPVAGLWAGLSLFLAYASFGYFFTAQPDGWAGLFLVCGIAPLIGGPQQPRIARFAGCGVAVALATLIKPFFAAFLLVPAIDLIISMREDGTRRNVLPSVACTLGFGLPIGLIVVWFAARGALVDFFSVHLLYTSSSYSGAPSVVHRLTGIFKFLWGTEFAVMAPILFIGIYSLWGLGRRIAGMLVGWFGVALFAVVLQGKFFEYHWAPIYPPLVAVSAMGLWLLVNPRAERQATGASIENVPAAIILAVCVMGLAYGPMTDIRLWIGFMTGRTSVEDYHKEFGHADDPFSAFDDIAAAQYVASHTQETDRVLVFGNNATINFLSARQNPTRFVFGLPLTRPGGMRDGYRKEFLDKIASAPPAYIVVGMAHSGTTAGALRNFPEFVQILAERYALETTIGHLDVYRRRS
jgi:hypothetical protein